MADAPVTPDQDWTQQGIVDAAGELRITWDSGGSVNWRVTQVSVEMETAPIGAVCFIRKGGKLVTPMIATGDVAGGDPAVMVRPGQEMTAEWSGCTPGDVGRVYVIYDRVGWST